MYHIETTNGVIEFDRDNADTRSVTQYFAELGKATPAQIRVLGWPFATMYRVGGTEENGLFIASEVREVSRNCNL